MLYRVIYTKTNYSFQSFWTNDEKEAQEKAKQFERVGYDISIWKSDGNKTTNIYKSWDKCERRNEQ